MKFSVAIVFFVSFFLVSCQTTNQSPKKFEFNSKDFIGEQYDWPVARSSHVKSLNCWVQFFGEHEMLYEAKPYCRMFTQNELIAQTYFTTGNSVELIINKEVKADFVYAEMGIFYCTTAEKGLCIQSKVLTKFLLNPSLPAEDFSINYRISKSSYSDGES